MNCYCTVLEHWFTGSHVASRYNFNHFIQLGVLGYIQQIADIQSLKLALLQDPLQAFTSAIFEHF